MNIILTSFVEVFFFFFFTIHKCLIGTATLKNVICPFIGMAGSLCHPGRKNHGDVMYLTSCDSPGGVTEENKQILKYKIYI